MKEKGSAVLIVVIAVLILTTVGGFILFSLQKSSDKPSNFLPQKQQPDQVEQTESKWQDKGVVISGQYADADVVDLGNGQYRMYYSAEPETAGFEGQVFSAISQDGINWKQEEGIRMKWAIFPDVVKLSNGKWRMYFQNAGVIKSAISSDGLDWTDEPGVRIYSSEPGFKLDNVGAQGTIILGDGTFVMLYRGVVNETYKTTEKVPNKTIGIYFWATSKDGLTFEKRGMAIDSRNEILFGATDGAEWVKWDDELRIYFWSYAGVFYVTYKDGVFSQPVFSFTNNKDLMARFAPNPPSDPALAKINGQWFMYYGQHTKGIYHAIRK